LGGNPDRELHHRAPCSAVDHGIATADFIEIRRPSDCYRDLLLHPRPHAAANAWPTPCRDFHGIGVCALGFGTVFLSNQAVISFIDDIVVFLFVADLSIVIRQNLKSGAGERQLRKACFPVIKTIESFNFAAQPSIDEDLVRTLLQGKYIERRENVVIVGKSGTGKTHLAEALGYAACLQNKRVLFTTASALVAELIDSHESRRLRQFYKRLDRLDLLIVDKMGDGRFSELGTRLLFEALTGGYERISLVITRTILLEKWGEVFESEYIARATVDRLTDRGHLLEATGDPYWKPGRNAVVSRNFVRFEGFSSTG
jgi:DNA replication protein DnaC